MATNIADIRGLSGRWLATAQGYKTVEVAALGLCEGKWVALAWNGAVLETLEELHQGAKFHVIRHDRAELQEGDGHAVTAPVMHDYPAELAAIPTGDLCWACGGPVFTRAVRGGDRRCRVCDFKHPRCREVVLFNYCDGYLDREPGRDEMRAGGAHVWGVRCPKCNCAGFYEALPAPKTAVPR